MRPAILTAALAGALATSDAPAAEHTAAELQLAFFEQAMQMFYLDSNYLTTIENLDDVFTPEADPPHQWINNGGGALVLRPGEGVPFRVFLTQEQFQGPYLTDSSGTPREGPDGDYDEGTPLDPWGNPYYFYSPLGLIEPKTAGLSLRHYGDQFDQYTFVSHGPDGIPSADDVIRGIGFTINEPAVSSAVLTLNSAEKAAAAANLRIRGYILGSTEGEILFDGESSGILPESWTSTEVIASLENVPDPLPSVSLRLPSGTETRSVELLIEDDGPPTRVGDWLLF